MINDLARARAFAGAIKTLVKPAGMTHGQALDLAARALGSRDWRTHQSSPTTATRDEIEARLRVEFEGIPGLDVENALVKLLPPARRAVPLSTDAHWNAHFAAWRTRLAAEGIDPTTTMVDAVMDTPYDFFMVGSRATWWRRSNLAKYPIVNWRDGVDNLVTGNPYWRARSSVDFPIQSAGSRDVADVISRSGGNLEVIAAAMTVASAAQRHWERSRGFARLAGAARDILKNAKGRIAEGGGRNMFLPHRNGEDLTDDVAAASESMIAEHVDTLRAWAPVDFRGWTLEAGAYAGFTERDVSNGHAGEAARRFNERQDRIAQGGKPPARPIGRSAATDDEIAVAQAIADYHRRNGLKAPPVEFDIGFAGAENGIACTIEGDKLTIVRAGEVAEPSQRGNKYGLSHSFSAQLRKNPDDRLEGIRALVHKALDGLMRYFHRYSMIMDHGGPREDPQFEGQSREPLWAFRVHAIARAFNPRIEELVAIDPMDVRADDWQGWLDVRDETVHGEARLKDDVIMMKEVRIAPGIVMYQDGNGTSLAIHKDHPITRADQLPGRPLSDLLDIPEASTVMIRTAHAYRNVVRVKIDDVMVRAADLPDGVRDWEIGGIVPDDWGRPDQAMAKKAKRPKKLPILHDVDHASWSNRRPA